MPPVTPETFAAHLRTLDEAGLAGLVADVWAACGWDVRVSSGTVVAEHDGGRERIRVHPAGSVVGDLIGRGTPALADADALVVARDTDRLRTAAAAADVTYVPPTELRRRLLYAIPREHAERLYETHVGESLVESPGSAISDATGGNGSDSDGGVTRWATARTDRVVVTLFLLVALVVAGVGNAGYVSVGGSEQQAVTPAGQFDTATGTPTESTAGSAGEPNGSDSAYPPGLSAGGVENATLLADAHLKKVLNRQYTLDVLFSGPPAATGFERWASVRWQLTVAGNRNFVLSATYRGAAMDPRSIDRGSYADGVMFYRRVETPNGTRYTAMPAGAADASAYAYFGRMLVKRYLATSSSRVERVQTENGTRYLVVATGTPDHLDERAAGYRARAWVTPEGRVVSLSVQYTTGSGGNVQPVRVGMEYRDYRTATVEEPWWLDEAKNATGR